MIIMESKLFRVLKILYKFKNLINRLYITFSKSLEKAGGIDVGL